MKPVRRPLPFALGLTLAVLISTAPPAAAQDWPHLRGPAQDGTVLLAAPFPSGELALATSWRVPLGSGYSGIVVAHGRAVTMFTDGEIDVVAAFDAATGGRQWSQPLGKAYEGHDGSADGPIATPVIDGERVFALGPRGRLLALALADGAVEWSKELGGDFGAAAPFYGYGVTPKVVDGVLVVPAGGSEGRAVVGLDPATGETLWSHGDGAVEYQAPVALTLGGEPQVVVVSGRRMEGLRAADGTSLWQHELGADDDLSSATATPAGVDRFLMLISGDGVLFEVTPGEQGWSVAERYRTNALGQGYALPVLHQGYFYGFRGQTLSCVDAATGERVWRSRPPGGRGLLLAGDHLVIFGAAGNVVIADASPAGYVERASEQALAASGYTWPSFAGGRIFVRNLDEMAAVAVQRAAGGAPQVADAADHLLARWRHEIEAAPDPAAKVAALVAEHEQWPIVDGDWVHFLYQGPAEDMAVLGTMNDPAGPLPMERIAGTDLYFRSYRLAPQARWDYVFVRDFGERILDPRNPNRVPDRWGDREQSELAGPGYLRPAHQWEPPPERRGTVEELTFKSRSPERERTVKVYLPAGYADGSERYPLLLVHDGLARLDKGRMARSLDNLLGTTVEPLVAVFIDPRDEWWFEAGGSGTGEYADMLAKELVPFLQERYRLRADAGSRAVLGQMGFGVSSLAAALRNPDVFGKVALQSVQLGLGFDDELFAAIAAIATIATVPRPPVRVYLDWNRYEQRNPDSDFDFAADSQRLHDALTAAGFTVTGGEVMDSFGWAGWRARDDDLLKALFPLGGG